MDQKTLHERADQYCLPYGSICCGPKNNIDAVMVDRNHSCTITSQHNIDIVFPDLQSSGLVYTAEKKPKPQPQLNRDRKNLL